MSVRSARRWHKGPYPAEVYKPHGWCTRPDPFGAVFEREGWRRYRRPILACHQAAGPECMLAVGLDISGT